MSRRAASFTQADVARALRAAEQVAPGRWRIRVNRQGEIVLEPNAPTASEGAGLSPLSPTDEADATAERVELLREPRL